MYVDRYYQIKYLGFLFLSALGTEPIGALSELRTLAYQLKHAIAGYKVTDIVTLA